MLTTSSRSRRSRAMYRLIVVFAALSQLVAGGAGDAADGTELLLTFLVHRHGDRTPLEDGLMLSDNIAALAEASAPYGYGELTNKGKQTAYQLGKSIRAKYDELLPSKYNSSVIYIRTTDSTRTKMTVLTAMAAVFPPTADSWSQEINWVPVPYTMIPEAYDPNLATSNCPYYLNALTSLYMTSSPLMERHAEPLEELSQYYGIDFASIPALSYGLYDLCVSQKSLGVPLSDLLERNLDALRDAAGDAMEVMFSDENYIGLGAGVLLNEFFEVASEVIAGNDTQAVRIYSAHDINVFSFQVATQVPRQGVPKYASSYALELRRVTATGQYVVLPVYTPSPEEDAVYLQVEGCDLLCDIKQFYQINSKYTMTENEWRSKCQM